MSSHRPLTCQDSCAAAQQRPNPGITQAEQARSLNQLPCGAQAAATQGPCKPLLSRVTFSAHQDLLCEVQHPQSPCLQSDRASHPIRQTAHPTGMHLSLGLPSSIEIRSPVAQALQYAGGIVPSPWSGHV